MPSNREFVQSLYDAFARGDADIVLAGLAPDVEWNEAEGSPYADLNPYRGPDEVGNGVFGRLLADYDEFSVQPSQLMEDGNMVVALGRYQGTHRASGQRLDAPFAHAWTVQDGKVTAFQQYTDTAQYQRLASSG